MMNNNVCLYNCVPTQVLTINIPINDIAEIEIFNNEFKYDNDTLKWSYSYDNFDWSCWISYKNALECTYGNEGDFWVKTKVSGPITHVQYMGNLINDWNSSLAKCFEFGSIQQNPNQYNPYAGQDYAIGLYQQLSETVSSMIGIPIYYFKLNPSKNSKDITFKEYALMNVESVKQIKLIVQDGQMPSSRPEFSDFGFDFSTDWETEISKLTFATAFGDNVKPMEGDLVYVPMMKRMWMVNNAYDEKNEGFLWRSTTYKIMLIKYEEKSSVDLGDTQQFVDSLVKTKYDDLFGNDENVMSGSDETSAPTFASSYLYPVFESDAVRKYIKLSDNIGDTITSLNAKLINSPIYHNGIMVSENMYDFTSVTDESYIIYQKKFVATDASISFIISIGNDKCKGKLLNIGNIELNIDSDIKCTISLQNLVKIELEKNKTYFVILRWSKKLNILEMSAFEYSYPKEIPLYKLQKYHYKFDFDNPISVVSKYDIELEHCEEHDVVLYSFSGRISCLKVFNSYVNDIQELLQMYPTNQSLLINDTCRKLVTLDGVSLR